MNRYKFLRDNHIHEIDGRPLIGTSTVMKVLNKPLTWWASGLAVGEFGWLNSKKPENTLALRQARAQVVLDSLREMSLEDYMKKLDKAYKAHQTSMNESAGEGTDLHAELERFVKDHMRGVRGEYAERIKPFIEWTDRNVEKFLWSEMHCYSETFWVGGISDCGALLKTGKTVIIDFKSSKEAYASHFFQIAGYDLQISENGGYDSEGNKIFTLENPIDGYIVIPFRSEDSVPGYDFDVDKNREAFKACLTLYKITEKI